MELRDIEYFGVVAEYGSVRRAADWLGLSPPALSKSLRRLEKSMKAKLVERTPTGIALTPVGAALLTQAQRLRLTVDDILREATDLSQGRAGHLRVGTGPAFSEELPSAYLSLLKAASGLTVEIAVTDNDVMVPALRRGELDLVFNYIPALPYEGVVQEHLYDDDFVVCASADHRLARLDEVPLGALAKEKWALASPNNCVQWLRRAFQDRGLPAPQIVVQTRSLRLRLHTWSASEYLGFMSRRVLAQAAPRFRVKELAVKDLVWCRPVGVMYRKDAYLTPAAHRLIAIIRASLLKSAPVPRRLAALAKR